MNSVLMIAYHFPPEGSAGTYRSLRFVRQLAKLGWSPSVVTAKPYSYERYDPDLLKSVPDGVEVVRVGGRDPWQALQSWRGKRINAKLSAIPAERAEDARAAYHKPLRSRIRAGIRKIESWYYHPDMARPWVRPAVNAILKRSKRKKPDVIWATAGPVSAWIVAKKASELTGVPYVLDLRDPHGLSCYEPDLQTPEWLMKAQRRTMREAFVNAQAIVFLFDSVSEAFYRAFPGAIDPNKIHIIPNGYEGVIDSAPQVSSSNFTLLYTGTIVSYRYDTLLQAVASLRNTHPGKTTRLRVKFVGEGLDALANDAARLKISDIIETRRPVSRGEINRLEGEANALLILGRLPTIPGYELFAGAKLFSYLRANRPIFGVLPQDETRKVLERIRVSSVADANSPLAIATKLEDLIDSWSEGKLNTLLPDRDKCEMYSAVHQTEALVRALSGTQPSHPFSPGRVEMPRSFSPEAITTATA